MASNQSPPDFGVDNDDDSKTNDPMFVSAISPNTDDVPLDDEDDDAEESPFGLPPTKNKTPTSTAQTAGSTVYDPSSLPEQNDADDDDDDPFGTKTPSKSPSSPSTPSAQVPSSSPQPSSPVPPKSPSNSANLNVGSPPTTWSTAFGDQVPSTTSEPKVDNSESAAASRVPRQRINEGEIEITVSDPTKVGDGMSSYMTYRLTTKTSLGTFSQPEFSVNRRFSDFLGLHSKLVHKHLHTGYIIPSPPEKDTMLMAKVKTSKDDAIPADFIDRRRALLERYLNRLARHDKLIEDPDVKQFLELAADLPKSKETAALSGPGVLRAFSGISSSVSKLTTKTGEQDQWFEEKLAAVVELQAQLKRMFSQLTALFGQRKEAGQALKQFVISLNHLATNEEHPSLSKALTELANLKEKLDQINSDYSFKEYSTLTELVKEYVSLLDMVQLAFSERIRLHQQWLSAEDSLRKKREAKTKLEQSAKGLDKIPQAEKDIRDWEEKVEHGKQEFEGISATIKEEVEAFEQTRVEDFKKGIDQYLNNLIEQQEKVLQLWEGYLPEANEITV